MPASLRASIAVFAFAGWMAGCNFTQRGEPPPSRTLNYPMAIGLSPRMTTDFEGSAAPRFLYVANSNFDLRYNTGSLQAIDLVALDALIAETDECPGEDCQIVTDIRTAAGARLVPADIGIGSHVDGMFIAPDEGRIYLAVRSEQTLAVVDVTFDGGVAFHCDESFQDGDVIPRCGDAYVAGRHRVASERELELEGDPVAVTGGRLSTISDLESSALFILLAMRDGRVALFIDDRASHGNDFITPRLVDVRAGFPESLVTITMQPGTGVAWLTSARNSASSLGRAAVAIDEAEPYRSFVYDFGAVRVDGVDDAQDLRDVQFAGDSDRAFVLSRRPESVLSLDLSRPGPTAGSVGLDAVDEVGRGPSRLAVIEQDGQQYVLASCFDAKQLFIIHPFHGLVSVVGGFAGPFEISYDEHRQRLYMADFTTSQIRIVDMRPLATNGTPEVIATLGRPVTAGSLTD